MLRRLVRVAELIPSFFRFDARVKNTRLYALVGSWQTVLLKMYDSSEQSIALSSDSDGVASTTTISKGETVPTSKISRNLQKAPSGVSSGDPMIFR